MVTYKKILLVGAGNANILARQLRYYGVYAEAKFPPKFPALSLFRKFDIIYGVHLMSLTRHIPFIKLLRKKSLVHIIGSDAFRYSAERGLKSYIWKLTLNMYDEVLYVSKEVQQLIGLREGRVLPIPIDTRIFRKLKIKGEKRDILYYCPNPKIYRLDWILQYAKEHPDKTITILGYPYLINLPNVKVIPYWEYEKMPILYNMHRCLIRMTTHDGYPKMPYEALLCGLEVIWNGKKITEVPEEMLMERTIPKLILILESV
ncbi:MAG: hypothetical protein QXP91_11855 [Candidatus Methanomethylicia archaeon]